MAVEDIHLDLEYSQDIQHNLPMIGSFCSHDYQPVLHPDFLDYTDPNALQASFLGVWCRDDRTWVKIAKPCVGYLAKHKKHVCFQWKWVFDPCSYVEHVMMLISQPEDVMEIAVRHVPTLKALWVGPYLSGHALSGKKQRNVQTPTLSQIVMYKL